MSNGAGAVALLGGGAFATWLVLRHIESSRPSNAAALAPLGWIGFDLEDAAPKHRNRSAPKDRLSYRSVGAPGEPYPEWVRELKGSSGVYVIRDPAGEILYVGESHTGRLYETLTRHLQRWTRWKSWWRDQFSQNHDPGTTYDRERVEVAVRVTSPNRALDEEAALIRKLKPRDNLLGQADELEPAPF